MISIISAIAKNNCIGKENKLLWDLPEDMKHFRTITSLHPVIMGRKTFESIGRPLPNRRNIIITRDKKYLHHGVDVVHSLEEAFSLFKDSLQNEEVFIIGGAEIYKQSLGIADKLYITKVEKDFEGDAFFPEIKPEIWQEIAREEHEASEKNPIAFTFLEYIKK